MPMHPSLALFFPPLFRYSVISSYVIQLNKVHLFRVFPIIHPLFLGVLLLFQAQLDEKALNSSFSGMLKLLAPAIKKISCEVIYNQYPKYGFVL